MISSHFHFYSSLLCFSIIFTYITGQNESKRVHIEMIFTFYKKQKYKERAFTSQSKEKKKNKRMRNETKIIEYLKKKTR